MNAATITDIKQITGLFDRYYQTKTVTNCYLTNDFFTKQIEKNALFYAVTDNNLALFIKKVECYHLYFFINNFDEFFSFEMDSPVSMEIVFRGEQNLPEKIIGYWEQNGFMKHLIRDNLMVSFSGIPEIVSVTSPVEIKKAKPEDAENLHDIYQVSFDIYSGDMLTLQEIKEKIINEQIICAYLKDDLCGFLEYEIKNNNVWLNHIAVRENFRGMGISGLLTSEYINSNKTNENTRYQLWVIQNNTAAVNLYKKYGFGYNNKSTLSMLKLN